MLYRTALLCLPRFSLSPQGKTKPPRTFGSAGPTNQTLKRARRHIQEIGLAGPLVCTLRSDCGCETEP